MAALREAVLGRFREARTPSLAVAVARDGRILWEEGFGWADRETGLPATAHTPYAIASISKPLTATAVMVLRDRGAIGLDDRINDHLGEARLTARVGDAGRATVRRVANHTSGLPIHHRFFPRNRPARPPPMRETIRRYGHLMAEPGERFQYSNLGYGILELVIARVSGRSYEQFMRDEVFRPLGMAHSAVGIAPDLQGIAAARYGGDGRRLPDYDFDHRGGSAVFASAHDLALFGLFHVKAAAGHQARILSERSLDEMHAPSARRGEGGAYGIGWEVGRHASGRALVVHRGGMPGVSAALALVPSAKLVVVALANARSDLPHEVVEQVLAEFLPWLPPGIERARAALRVDAARASERFRPPRPLQGSWRGAVHTYEGRVPLALCVERSGPLRVRLGAQPERSLLAPEFREGRLVGRLGGDLGTSDTPRGTQVLLLSLRPRGKTLSGPMTALFDTAPGFPAALSHWVELSRTGEACGPEAAPATVGRPPLAGPEVLVIDDARRSRAGQERSSMPLYEFHCRNCQKDFTQALTLRDFEQKSYACPGCQSRDVEQVFENVQVITSKKS